MSTSVSETGHGVRGSAPQRHGKVAIPVRTGHGDDRFVEVELGSRVTAVLEVIAAERRCQVDELVLIRDQERDPLSSEIAVDEKYPHGCRHHVHHSGEVTVTVNYQAAQSERTFKRFEAIKDVLAWSIKVFEIDASMATEFELALHGQKEELFGAEHVGHFAGKNCELELDLVRGVIANGSCS